jgi:hypothetical protein
LRHGGGRIERERERGWRALTAKAEKEVDGSPGRRSHASLSSARSSPFLARPACPAATLGRSPPASRSADASRCSRSPSATLPGRRLPPAADILLARSVRSWAAASSPSSRLSPLALVSVRSGEQRTAHALFHLPGHEALAFFVFGRDQTPRARGALQFAAACLGAAAALRDAMGGEGRGLASERASDPSHGAARYRTRSSSHTPTSLACRPPRVKMKSPKARAQAGMQGWERARKRLAAWRTDVCVCRAVRARAFFTDSRGRWGKGIGGWAREHKLRHGSSSPSPKRARFFMVLSPSVRPVD